MDMYCSIPIINMEYVKDNQTPEYDLPINKDLQEYIYNKCLKYQIPYELALAVMKVESEFQKDLICKNDDTNIDQGIMQINSCHNEEFQQQGYTDILDPKQNIDYGLKFLSALYHKYKDDNITLMSYNMGENGCKKLVDRGITSSRYSRKVLKEQTNFKEGKYNVQISN
jgi:soluble lytic murein transglycosylase-like protein